MKTFFTSLLFIKILKKEALHFLHQKRHFILSFKIYFVGQIFLKAPFLSLFLIKAPFLLF